MQKKTTCKLTIPREYYMTNARVIGDNIRLIINNNSTDKQMLADRLGYSVTDLERLCEGRLLAAPKIIDDITGFFDTNSYDLLIRKDGDVYKGDGFVCCQSDFTKQENKDKILDMIDDYCELKKIDQ